MDKVPNKIDDDGTNGTVDILGRLIHKKRIVIVNVIPDTLSLSAVYLTG